MNKNKKRNQIIICTILILLSVVYTILIKKINVLPIGPNNTLVGFANINNYFKELIGFNYLLYDITNYLGYIAILESFIYAIIGLIQLIKRKNILKVDREILILSLFYITVIIIYIFFEKVIINYRPVLIDNELSASYPSSHTLLSLCLCGSSIIINKRIFRNKKIMNIENIISYILIPLIIIGRIFSGVHWFTDIIGGILISITLLTCFNTTLNILKKKRR